MGSKLGGVAPGFKPRTSCMRVRSVTITLRGRPCFKNIIFNFSLEKNNIYTFFIFFLMYLIIIYLYFCLGAVEIGPKKWTRGLRLDPGLGGMHGLGIDQGGGLLPLTIPFGPFQSQNSSFLTAVECLPPLSFPASHRIWRREAQTG